MELRNRLYPYPVLSVYSDDYVDSEFDIVVATEINREHIKLHVNYHLLNEELWDLVAQGKIEPFVHLECPTTNFRVAERISDSGTDILIDATRVNIELQLCSFLIANDDLTDFSNELFNEIYAGLSFDIDKHNIVGIGSQMKIPIDKDYDDIKHIHSIFTVIPNLDPDITLIQRDFYMDKILIKIPQKQFDAYKIVTRNPKNNSHMHSIFIMPILVEIIELLKAGHWEEFEDRKWFRSLRRTLKKNHIPFDEESIQNQESFTFAQRIAESPMIKSLDLLFEQSLGGGDEDDEN